MIINHDFGTGRTANLNKNTQSAYCSVQHFSPGRPLYVGFGAAAPILMKDPVADSALILPIDRFLALSVAQFRHMAPKLVVSPLVLARHDAVDLAHHLCQMKFRGKYRAVVDQIPSAHLICREVRSIAPGLDLDILELTKLLRKSLPEE